MNADGAFYRDYPITSIAYGLSLPWGFLAKLGPALF
jgi:hypothetical protein